MTFNEASEDTGVFFQYFFSSSAAVCCYTGRFVFSVSLLRSFTSSVRREVSE